MSARLRFAVLAALGLALPCAAAEPSDPPPAATPAPVPASPPVPVPAPGTAPLEAPAALIDPVPVFAPLGSQATALPPSTPPLRPAPALEASPTPPPVDSVPLVEVTPAPERRSGQQVFTRLRRGLSPHACDAGGNSARWRARYAGSPVAFSRRLESVLPMIDFVGAEVERAGLPAEFTFIPLVESWYQPGALGVGGPAGMWQMIGTTAKNHGIHIRPGYDGRLSPVESTRAALSYLNVLKGMFGDWQAIVMAYNAGEGRMQRALRRAGSRTADAAQRRPHGLSNITYDYVDKLQALSCLVQQPQRNKVRLPLDASFEPLVPVLVDDDIASLDQFASLYGKDSQLLRRLNPGFREGRIVAGVPRLLLSTPRPIALAPTAPTAVAPALLAQAEGSAPAIDVAALEAPARSLAGAPAPVLVPAAVAVPVATPPGQLAPVPDAPPNADPPEPVHEVVAGDTLESIAAHYQLPVEQILRANDIRRDAELRPGQRLRLVP